MANESNAPIRASRLKAFLRIEREVGDTPIGARHSFQDAAPLGGHHEQVFKSVAVDVARRDARDAKTRSVGHGAVGRCARAHRTLLRARDSAKLAALVMSPT